MRCWSLVLVACNSSSVPKPAERTPTNTPPSAAPTTPTDVPRAIALFRAGVAAQCDAASGPRFRWIRSDSKWAIAMRAERPDLEQQTEADYKAQCLQRKDKVAIAPDIIFALDVMDRYLDRKSYFDDNPYTKDGTNHPNQGEDAFSEAILASDPRLANLELQQSYCFAATIKEALWRGANLPGVSKWFDDCVAQKEPHEAARLPRRGDLRSASARVCRRLARRLAIPVAHGA